jgi:hypothetical protein
MACFTFKLMVTAHQCEWFPLTTPRASSFSVCFAFGRASQFTVKTRVLAARHHLKIGRFVISWIAVDVMNNLVGGQMPPDLLSSDDAVFVDVFTAGESSIWIAWRIDNAAAPRVVVAAFPIRPGWPGSAFLAATS